MNIQPQNAIDLAIFRIVVCGVILLSADVHSAAHFAALPIGVRHGLGAAITPQVAESLHIVACVAVAGCLLGTFTRFCALIALFSLTILLGLPIGAGAIRHYHHLVWFMGVLAATPCGDALSIDRLIAVRRGRMPVVLAPARAYGLALDLVWLTIGALYFFPGLWKLLSAGVHWPDVMVQQMHWKWAQFHTLPDFRLDLHPWLLPAAAWSVVAFELCVLPMQFFRKTRPWLILAALGFHLAAGAFMYLPFVSLWLCYAGLFHWTPALDPLQTWILQRFSHQDAPSPQRRLWPIALLTAPLLAGVLWAGATRDVFGWPFACYPTFDRPVGEWMPRLDLQVIDTNGHSAPLPMHTGFDAQQALGLQWQLLREPAALRAWLQRRARQEMPQNTVEIQAWRVLQSTQPGHWQQVRQRQLLARLPLVAAPKTL